MKDSVAITMITDVLYVYREEECSTKSALEMINSIMYKFYGQQNEKVTRELTAHWLRKFGGEINFFVGDLN